LEGLSRAIGERFGVTLGTTALWRQVHKMGFRLKVPMPVHAKADQQKQNDFKKNR
jgi:transposase